MDTSFHAVMGYVLYALAYGGALVAFSMSSIFWLRLLTMVSSACYVVYYFVFPASPLWPDIISEGGLVALNVVMLIVLMRRRAQIKFTEEEKELHSSIFSNLSSFEFFKLMRAAEWKSYGPGHTIAKKGQVVPSLYFIYNGAADVMAAENAKIAELGDGNFAGEISFKLKQPATATVRIKEPTRIVEWSQENLHGLLKRNPAMRNCVETLISTDMARKLTPMVE
jgi:hypothetical protein